MNYFEIPNDEDLVRERKKARELREGDWWRNQLGKGRCHYCGESFHPSQLSMDHKIPLARGGRSTRGNLAPCCKDCNTEKGHQRLTEWMAKRQDAGKPLACAGFELD